MTDSTLKTVTGGRLIAFEGIDGAGKTTQARRAVEALKTKGYDAVLLREPTDGPHGRRLREIMVSGRDQVDPMEEFRLFCEDRREDVERNIRPALERGAIVCMDRYYISSIAYQGALGLDPVFIRRENERFAPVPDLILYFRLPLQQGLGRIHASRAGGQNLFERADYLERVRAIFESLDFHGMLAVDASADPDAVHEQVMRAINQIIGYGVRKP